MSVLFDQTSSSGYQTAQVSYNFSILSVGGFSYVLIGVSMLSVAGATVISVTVGALSATRIEHSETGGVRAELWGVNVTTSGGHNIVVTLSAALDSIASAISLLHVERSQPFGDSGTQTTTGDANISLDTIQDNSLIVDVISAADTAITVGSGQTSRQNVSGTLGSGAMSTEGPVSPTGTVAMEWTDSSGVFAYIAVEFVEDVTVPTITSWTVSSNGTQIIGTLSESCPSISSSGSSTFTIHGTSASYASFSLVGSTITITLNGHVLSGQTITIDHDSDASGITDPSGNILASFSGQPVTNNSNVSDVPFAFAHPVGVFA